MNLFENMRNYKHFTETESEVVSFILDHPQTVCNMSIRDLAASTYTSAPTVIRICRKLDYEGYKDFKRALIVEVENEKHQISYVDASRPFYQSGTALEIEKSIVSLYHISVTETVKVLDIDELYQIAEAICHADNVYFFAIGDSNLTTQLFANKLMKLNIHLIDAARYGDEISESNNVKETDFALFVSYKGSVEWMIRCAENVKKHKCPAVIITGNEKSRYVKLFQHKILIPNIEQRYNIATFHSQISIGLVLNILYSYIYSINYAMNHRHKDLLDSLQT